MRHDESIRDIVESVSFDDILEEIGRVIEGDVREDQTILVISMEMYEVIADFGRMVGPGQTAHVETKY